MSTIERLREEFPRLVWELRGGSIYGSSRPTGHTVWGVMLGLRDGVPVTIVTCGKASNGSWPAGKDWLAAVRRILTAEGERLAKESDERADVARALGAQQQADLSDLRCKPGHLLQPCAHCGQRSTGLCEVLVARRIGALEAGDV